MLQITFGRGIRNFPGGAACATAPGPALKKLLQQLLMSRWLTGKLSWIMPQKKMEISLTI